MVLVLDNYDSFTYNLVQYLGQCGAEVEVRRNDEIDLAEVRRMEPEGILLSPGPCTPDRSGVCLDVLRWALTAEGGAPPILGVCLGHQAIAHAAGGEVLRARRIVHGKTSRVRHDGGGVFKGMPNPFRAVRYHSLALSADSVPAGFVVTATAEEDGEIMGIRHEARPIEGVQFHPESVLTEDGFRIIENFLGGLTARRGRSASLPR